MRNVLTQYVTAISHQALINLNLHEFLIHDFTVIFHHHLINGDIHKGLTAISLIFRCYATLIALKRRVKVRSF